MTFSPDIFKKHFPLFQNAELSDLIYFDNAATTQKPDSVIQKIVDFYTTSNANTHRASHTLARKATDTLELVRHQIADYLNAQHHDIIFCRGATEGLNLIATILSSKLNQGDQIILSHAEHHANLLPWQRLVQQHKLEIIFLPHDNGIPDLTQLPKLTTDKTKIISLALASNVLGYRLPIEEFKDFFQATNAYVILDGAQALAHEQVNVMSLGCDFLVGSAHKMFGPTGIGFIYGRYELLEGLPPYHLGGEMIESVTATTASFAAPPYRFEAGTLALADIAGFGAALDFLAQFDRQSMITHEKALTQKLHSAFENMPEIKLFTNTHHNVGITSFVLNDNVNGSTADLALWLDEYNIAVRVGYHCAQPLYQTLGLGQGLRISVAPYNTVQDCDYIIFAVRQWLDHLHTLPNLSAPSIQAKPKSSLLFENIEYFNISVLEQHQQWQKKYLQLMTWGNQVERKPQIQLDQFKISGCEANTWLAHQIQQDKYFFAIDSDSRIVRGLGALILCWFQGKTSEEISQFQWKEHMKHHGLEKHLSSSRSNGFEALIKAALKSTCD